jgi:biotin-(acetyl-CoA carboxylase) ligase
MPFKSNSTFDSLLAMTALCNDAELRALADKCQNLIADRERIKREELRQELMGNLQKAIGDILHNGFALYIQNTERNENDGCEHVYFDTKDIYHIELE